MAIMKKQLKGENLCNLSCTEQKEVIHPENDITDVLMTEETSDAISLKDWILGGVLPDNPTVHSSLIEWLQAYYNGNIFYQMPTASASTKGGVKVGQYLTIDDAVLSVDKESLNIKGEIANYFLDPTHTFTLPVAGNPTLGGVRIFNEWLSTKSGQEGGINIKDGGTISFDPRLGIVDKLHFHHLRYKRGTDIPDYDDFYIIPVDIIKEDDSSSGIISLDDSVYNIIANIPFAILQGDWNQSDRAQSDYIKNKPNLATVATSGSYNDLTNKPTIPAAPVQSDWNEGVSSSLAYIQHKPILELDRTVNGPSGSEWDLDTIANTIFTGNSVVNLDSDNIIDALTFLLNVSCKIKNITLYIPHIENTVVVKVDEPVKLTCYINQSNITYTDDDAGNYGFDFGDDMTRIDYFKNESEVILYITGYTSLTPSNN